jgi:Xaa-Pro aminopeptidase
MAIVKEEQWIKPEEFRTRVGKIREEMERRDLFGVVVLGHSCSPENLTYVTNYVLVGIDNSPYAGSGGGWQGACMIGSKGSPALVLDRDYWLDKAARVSWIEDLRYDNGMWGEVANTVAEKVAASKSKRLGVVADGIPINKYRQFETALPEGIEIVDFDYCFDRLRSIKSPTEIAIMQEIVDMQIEVYDLLTPEIQDGIQEWELQERFRYELRKRGATHCESLGIMSGENSEVSLAYPQSSRRVIRDGDMVSITVFCYYKNYTAGIDRPFVCGPKASDMARRLSDIEVAGLERCLAIMRPGALVEDMYKAAYYDYIIPELDKAGFTNYKIQGYMGHGTGLGSTESPMLNPKSDLRLEEGMVVHVEPGIYVTGKKMGLRTAEMVEITKDGINVMTKKLPRRRGCLA